MSACPGPDPVPAMLTRLGEAPVAGVSMSNVALLRLDTGGGLAPGNKQFKLRANLAAARRLGINRLVSFGGAWSNHLHALAAVGAEQGFATVGIVRGADQGAESATLADARRWGMQIVRVSREEYRRRHAADYLAQLQQEYGPCLVIPEGGANTEGARGCMDIAGLIRTAAPAMRHILVPVGTATTLAGLVAAETQIIDRIEPWLALVGLRLFFELNQSTESHQRTRHAR